MLNVKPPFSIRLIYWISNMGFWVYVGIMAIMLVLMITMLTGYQIPVQKVRLALPIHFEVLEHGNLELASGEYPLSIEATSAQLLFEEVPPPVLQFVVAMVLGVLLMGFGVLWYLKKMATNLYRGQFFEYANIAYLRNIAWFLLGFWAYHLLLMMVRAQYLIPSLTFESIRFDHRFDLNAGLLIFALALWGLCHIFSHGLHLQQEQDLTI